MPRRLGVRYVYNWGLRLKTDAYYQTGTRLYYKDLSAQRTVLNRQPETVWLNEVSSVTLQPSLRPLTDHSSTALKGVADTRNATRNVGNHRQHTPLRRSRGMENI